MDTVKLAASGLLAGLGMLAWTTAQAASTLDAVRTRGSLLCGIDRSEAEYSSTDEHGSRAAFDRDLCRAVAVAVLGEHARVVFTYYADDVTSMQALADGRADLVASLSVSATHAVWHANDAHIGFSAPVLYDGTHLMVPAASGIAKPAQLAGKKICFLSETNTEQHLHAWFGKRGLDLLPFPFQEEGEMEAAFVTGNCAALAGDPTRLAQTRIGAGAGVAAFPILDETLGADTLAMGYRLGDSRWKTVVDWTRELLVGAEATGLRSLDLNAATPGGPAQDSPLLHGAALLNEPLHLDRGWAAAVIRTVGNYGEVFERDLGQASPMRLARGANRLEAEGGLLHAEPFE